MCIVIQHFSVRPRLANINKIGCVLKHARRRRKILAFLDFKTSISIAKTQFQYDFAPQNAKKTRALRGILRPMFIWNVYFPIARKGRNGVSTHLDI